MEELMQCTHIVREELILEKIQHTSAIYSRRRRRSQFASALMLMSLLRAAPRLLRTAGATGTAYGAHSLAIHAGAAPLRRVGLAAAVVLGGSIGGSAISTCKPAAPSATSLNTMADALFESNQYDQLVEVLREEVRRVPDCVDILWRLARGLKKMSDPLPKATQEPLVREALALAERAIKVDDACGPAHKW